MKRYFLHPDVNIKVIYEDLSKFGSPLSNKTDNLVRELFGEVLNEIALNGYQRIEIASQMSKKVIEGEAFSIFFEKENDTIKIRDEVIYPDIKLTKPILLFLVREKTQQKIEVNIPESHWKQVHNLISDLENVGIKENDETLSEDMQTFLLNLIIGEFVYTESEININKCIIENDSVTFLGHNSVLVSSKKNKILVDPLIFPTSDENPKNYQPLQVRQLGFVNAIIITHSHPDHFDPGSLLRFPSNTLLIVPKTDQENILSADFEYRLYELGFSNIKVLDWWHDLKVGEIEIHSLPFYGEQPTDGETLNKSIRNNGNTYLVRTTNSNTLFLADSGFDGLGNVKDLANKIRNKFGEINFVFSGYRGWILYPFQYLFSSVARYLLFVPPNQWGARQQIMTTAEQSIDIAERIGAEFLIPYADGGAPWHWRIELGPQLDGNGKEISGFDYFPERVVQVAGNRTELLDGNMMKSIVKVIVMRPNQSIVFELEKINLKAFKNNIWPYSSIELEILISNN